MKIINLSQKGKMYTSNVHLVLGSWNAIEDVNTLVDVGRDQSIIERIMSINTGLGKQKVERVILTHSHYDHSSLLPTIKEVFKPVVYGFSNSLQGVDIIPKDGQILRLGDRMFEVIHTPGHSSDSLCLYCETDKVLFAGDTPVIIQSVGGTYEDSFVHALEKLCRRDIVFIYFGHGDPITEDGNALLRNTLQNVKKSLLLWKNE